MTDTIESLRQQLTECQAREKVLRQHLEYFVWRVETGSIKSVTTYKFYKKALAMPSDSTALDEAIKQAKREFSEKLAVKFGKTDAHFIRRMAPAPDATP